MHELRQRGLGHAGVVVVDPVVGHVEPAEGEQTPQRATTAELSELTTKLATTRDDLARMKEAHDGAQAALAAKKAEFTSTQAAIASARTELAALEQRVTSSREQVSERTGTVKAGKPQRRKVSLRRKKRARS